MRLMPVVPILFLAFACGEETPRVIVVRTLGPPAEDVSVPPAPSDLVPVGVDTLLPREADQPDADRTQLDAYPEAEVKLVKIQVTVPAELSGETLPRLVLLDPARVAEGFDEANRASPTRWSWNVAEAFGEELTVDTVWSHGGVTSGFSLEIPRPSRGTRVLARLAGRVAVSRLPRDDNGPWIVDLSKSVEVLRDVLVRRVDGRAAEGIEVMPAHRSVDSLVPMTPEFTRRARRSDKDGRAVLAMRRGLVIVARVIGGDPVLGEGTDPCRITLPRVVVVRILMQFPAGANQDGGGIAPTVSLIQLGTGFGGAHEPLGTVEAPGGVARLYPVRAGAIFSVVATADDWEGFAKVVAPLHDGEELDVVVSMTETPAVRFRAIDVAGEPVVGAKLGIRIDYPRGHEYSVTSLEDGRVICRLPGRALGREFGDVYIREVVASRDVNDGRVAMVTLPTATAGIADLGVVTLRPVPTIVAGRVVDGEGDAVANARLKIESPRESSLILRGSRDSPPFPGSAKLARARSDSSGVFRIRMGLPDGSLPKKTLQLEGRRGAAITLSPVPFWPGQLDVVVKLETGGKLRVDTTRHSREEMGKAHLTLRRDGDGDSERFVTFGRNQVLSKLRPGSYSLYVSEGSRSDVLVLDGIQVQAGQTLEDPRLNPLDVSPVLQFRTLQVLSKIGDAPAEIELGARGGGFSGRFTKIDVRLGRARIPVWPQSEPSTYVIRAEGFRDLEVRAIVDGGVLSFEEGIPVTLQLQGAELPGEPFQFVVHNSPVGVSDVAWHWIEFNAAGQATTKLPKAGSYKLRQGYDSVSQVAAPWVGAEFTVPYGGGKILIQPKVD